MRNAFDKIRPYINNSSWILLEKSVGLGITFITTIIIARYLGPNDFGVLAYAASLMSFFAILGHMGLSGLVVRDLVKQPEETAIILGTTLGLKAFGSFAGFIALVVVAALSENLLSKEFWIIILVSGALLANPLDVSDFWFQAHVQAKYPAISRLIAHVATAALRLVLVYIGAKLLLFALAYLTQALVVGLLMLIFYSRRANIKLAFWRFSWHKAKSLVSQSWLVFLGSLLAIINLKVDQIMLKWIAGTEEVGVYAVAATLSEAWYFVPVAIVASLFPKLIQLREQDCYAFNNRFQQLLDFLFVLAALVATFVTLVAQPVVTIFFGKEYMQAAPILAVHVWAALFVFMRAAFSKWILIENILVFSLISQGFGAMANVALNMVLIPQYSGYGAAIATLISYAISSYFALLFSRHSRPVFWMMTKAIISPLRYTYGAYSGRRSNHGREDNDY